jgi:hypothetical protein
MLLGLAIGFYGAVLWGLRCFDTCPTDPAENVIIQVLTLSGVGLGLAMMIAAATLRTRVAVAGAWIITVLGALMAVGGVVSLVLMPSLQFPADRSSTITFSLIDIGVGAALVISGRRVRNR